MEYKYFAINEKGHSVKCKLYYNNIRTIDKMVVFGHGFGGHKDNKATERFAQTLLSKQKNCGVICFNLPCHGDDVKKKFVLKDCEDYLDLVLNYIRNTIGISKIYAYATSFGGYLFMLHIHKNGNPFYKVALRAPVVNMYEILMGIISKNGDMPLIEKGREVAIGFDRKVNVGGQFLEDLQGQNLMDYSFIDYADDVLIIQGLKDEVVSPAQVIEFAENNVIEYISVDNADHRFQDYAQMGNAIRDIIEFFEM